MSFAPRSHAPEHLIADTSGLGPDHYVEGVVSGLVLSTISTSGAAFISLDSRYAASGLSNAASLQGYSIGVLTPQDGWYLGWLAASGAYYPKQINHNQLTGLDNTTAHTQYALKGDAEAIIGAWTFYNQILFDTGSILGLSEAVPIVFNAINGSTNVSTVMYGSDTGLILEPAAGSFVNRFQIGNDTHEIGPYIYGQVTIDTQYIQAPFIIGAKPYGQLVYGLNADQVQGYYNTDPAFNAAAINSITVSGIPVSGQLLGYDGSIWKPTDGPNGFVTSGTSYTKAETDLKYVDATGDTVTGALTFTSGNGNTIKLTSSGSRLYSSIGAVQTTINERMYVVAYNSENPATMTYAGRFLYYKDNNASNTNAALMGVTYVQSGINTSSSVYGVRCELQQFGPSTASFMVGGNFVSYTNGNGTRTNTSMMGGNFGIQNAGVGSTITLAKAGNFSVQGSAGTVVSGFGVYIDDVYANDGNATIQNYAGLYIGNCVYDVAAGDNTGNAITIEDQVAVGYGSEEAAKGNLWFKGGTYLGGHIQFGNTHIWSDGTHVYFKNSKPTTATDGIRLDEFSGTFTSGQWARFNGTNFVPITLASGQPTGTGAYYLLAP